MVISLIHLRKTPLPKNQEERTSFLDGLVFLALLEPLPSCLFLKKKKNHHDKEWKFSFWLSKQTFPHRVPYPLLTSQQAAVLQANFNKVGGFSPSLRVKREGR
jgi:hypothetical protein